VAPQLQLLAQALLPLGPQEGQWQPVLLLLLPELQLLAPLLPQWQLLAPLLPELQLPVPLLPQWQLPVPLLPGRQLLELLLLVLLAVLLPLPQLSPHTLRLLRTALQELLHV
jgi:hypothetical protein